MCADASIYCSDIPTIPFFGWKVQSMDNDHIHEILATGWRAPAAMPCASDLPEIRHEAIAHLLRVFSIPRQIIREELLLVEDSPYQRRYYESKNREPPP